MTATMMKNTEELNLNELEMVTGGATREDYLRKMAELHNAVFANGVGRYHYEQFLREDDDLDEEELLEKVLLYCFNTRLTFKNYELIYDGGSYSHEYICKWIRSRNH